MKLSSTLCIGRILCLLILLVIAGCGGQIDWFPEYKRQPTTPDKFSFPAKTGVLVGKDVTSDPITVAGLTADTSPISISGSVGSNSKYSINGAAATDAKGTVKNGDKVTVTHTASSIPFGTTESTLTIGDVTGVFTSTTQLVTLSAFTTRTTVGALVQTYAVATSHDGLVNTHVIKISDSNNTAVYSVGDFNNNPTIFTNAEQVIPILNNLRIFVRKEPSTTTTLTIDDVAYPVALPTP